MSHKAYTTQQVSIEARVFRKGKKPRYIPTSVWRWAARKRIPGSGRWENLGEIANSSNN